MKRFTYLKTAMVFIFLTQLSFAVQVPPNNSPVITNVTNNHSHSWDRQYGTSGYEHGLSADTDSSGNIYVTGYTNGALDGNTYSGSSDIFLTKYSRDGSKQWTKQYGSTGTDEGNSVATDNSGNVYITGRTMGALDNNDNNGSSDIFLTKFSIAGTKQWTKQYGSSGADIGYSVASDSNGNIYVVGSTSGTLGENTSSGENDIFITKFDNNGTKLWTKQYGSNAADEGRSVVVDPGGNIYIAGFTQGALYENAGNGSYDIFLTKYNTDGIQQWTKQYGSNTFDAAYSLTSDSNGNIYIVGQSYGVLEGASNSGSDYIFLIKYDSNGERKWSRQYGLGISSAAFSVAVSSSEDIYISGIAYDVLENYEGDSNWDIFLTKYSNDGILLWTKKYGSNLIDYAFSVTPDDSGDIYIAGYTSGALNGNANSGGDDIFLSKFTSSITADQIEGTLESIDINATDTDGDTLSYTISGGVDSALFSIDSSSGMLSFVTVPDTGTPADSDGDNIYEVEVQVSDGNGGSDTISLAISVTVTTNNAPQITNTVTAIEHNEGVTQVVDIDANDTDGDTLTYMISGGEDSALFSIDSTSGILGFVTAPDASNPTDSYLDNIYKVEVRVSDGNGGSDSISLEISVLMLPNNPPVITNAANYYTSGWGRQYGTSGYDEGRAVTTDNSGNIYVAGYANRTPEDLNTQIVSLRKYDSDGTNLWTKQYGSDGYDKVESVTTDSSGNVYLTGSTTGSLEGNTHIGSEDIFLSKFKSDGTKLWTKQYGTYTSDYGRSVVADDSGSIYILGQTFAQLDGNDNNGRYDVFISKFDNNGTKLWTKLHGSTEWDEVNSATIDGNGNFYVTGWTNGAFDDYTNSGHWDIYLAKYDSNGTNLWVRQYGTSGRDEGKSIAVDNSGNVYVTGFVSGALDGNTHSGNWDIFLSKFNSDGIKQWTSQYGTSSADTGHSVFIDNNGYIYIYGRPGGYLDDTTPVGSNDMFLSQYSSDGVRHWTIVHGTTFSDVANAATMDHSGNIYTTGYISDGAFDGYVNNGYSDIFLSKFEQAITMQHLEGSEQAIDINATDADGDLLTYSVSGGVDSGQFSIIDNFTGVVYYNAAPYVSSPTDSDGDNMYELEVTAEDEFAGLDTIKLYISVVSFLDNDHDGMSNDFELAHGLNPDNPSDATLDADGDSLSNLEEYNLGTDPRDEDTDDDGMDDGYENQYGFNPLSGSDAGLDADSDGYTNLQEYLKGTDPKEQNDKPAFVKNDFDRDFRADILWGADDFKYRIWHMSGTGKRGYNWIGTKTNWSAKAIDDFDGDGIADILWKRYDGKFTIWTMKETGRKGTIWIGNKTGWSIEGTGDFDGDKKSDILWKKENGKFTIWTMNETGRKGTIWIGEKSSWIVEGTGDFDGDGFDDILWRRADGTSTIWLMDAGGKRDAIQLGKKDGWVVEGIGDFDNNNDGRADILWRDSDFNYRIWLINESGKKGAIWIGNKAEWNARSVADYDGDGKADILWEKSNGKFTIWLMDEDGKRGSVWIGSKPWIVMPERELGAM